MDTTIRTWGYGLHNALTGYSLKGWQKRFKWLLQPFSQCQYNNAIHKPLVQLLDMQVALKDGCWYGSHGLAWYDVKFLDLLENLCITSKHLEKVFYLRLGYDHHFGNKKDLTEFKALVNYIRKTYKDHIILYEYFIESPWQLTTLCHPSVFERYWSIGWAKEMTKRHWYNAYLFLPLPRLWAKFYKKQWFREFHESGKEIFMTDFV